MQQQGHGARVSVLLVLLSLCLANGYITGLSSNETLVGSKFCFYGAIFLLSLYLTTPFYLSLSFLGGVLASFPRVPNLFINFFQSPGGPLLPINETFSWISFDEVDNSTGTAIKGNLVLLPPLSRTAALYLFLLFLLAVFL